MGLRRFALFLLVFLTFSTLSPAQKADVSFVVGGAFASDAKLPSGIVCITAPCPTTFNISTKNHVFYEGTGAIRLANFKLASLHLEVPIAGVPSSGVRFSGSGANTNATSDKVSTVFVTPSLRVKLAPGFPISPFASIGGGWARYNINGNTSNKGALQFGGGVDIKTGIPLLGFRAEVRDFVSDQPFAFFTSLTNPQPSIDGRRHNVLAGGGIVLRF